MTAIKRLGLTKLFLWMEAERYQTYPSAMARLTPGRTYTRQQIAEELFGLSTGSNRKPQRESLVYNTFGMLQTAEDKLVLRGINLFKRVTPNGSHLVSGMKVWERYTDEWAPTPEAEALGKAYLQILPILIGKSCWLNESHGMNQELECSCTYLALITSCALQRPDTLGATSSRQH